MEIPTTPMSYDERLRGFNDSLNRVLSGAVLAPTSTMSNMPLTLALLDITHAVRSKRPVQALIDRAFEAFTVYAAV